MKEIATAIASLNTLIRANEREHRELVGCRDKLARMNGKPGAAVADPEPKAAPKPRGSRLDPAITAAVQGVFLDGELHTVKEIAKAANVGRSQARSAIGVLVAQGKIVGDANKRNRRYSFPAI